MAIIQNTFEVVLEPLLNRPFDLRIRTGRSCSRVGGPGKGNHQDSRQAHGGKNGECQPVTSGSIIYKAGNGWPESGTGHGKQTGQSRDGRKG
jgi:hypothetical protein